MNRRPPRHGPRACRAALAIRTDRAALAAALYGAREIASLCRPVERPELADDYITAGLSPEAARHALVDRLADEDEATQVDTTPPPLNKTIWQRSEGRD